MAQITEYVFLESLKISFQTEKKILFFTVLIVLPKVIMNQDYYKISCDKI